MKNGDKKILDWAIGKIENEFKDEVALLIGHGFGNFGGDVPGSAVEQFKGEFDYFVPDSDRAYKLTKSFIVDNICYDLYPRNWESIESMAQLNDCHTGCLADANILYARSQADRDRFEAVRLKLFENLKDAGFVYNKAMGRLSMAMEIFQTMAFSEKLCDVRVSSAFILDYLAQGVALVNGRYFKRGTQYQLEEMAGLAKMPPGFETAYRAVINAQDVDELKIVCHRTILITQKFLAEFKPTSNRIHKPDFHGLADWYQEMGHSWRKIYNGCATNDAARVFFLGSALQHELDIIREEFGLKEMDIMGGYSPNDLSVLHSRAKEIEKYITDTIISNSVNIARFNSVELFLAKN